MTPRLRHIADHAGVSEATVSRVVNNRPGVGEDTRQKVLLALAKFGYSASPERRHNRAGLVGLLIPELNNPVFPAIAQHLAALLNGRRFTTVLCTATEDGVTEDEHIEMLFDRGMSGLIVVSGKNADTTADHGMYRRLDEHGMPMVFVNGAVIDIDAPVVSCDDAHAASAAVRHLAEMGHRRIGCIVGPRRYVPVQRRLAGYATAVADLGLEEFVAESFYTVEGGAATAADLLDAGVTAIVAASDLMAFGAIRAARARGLSVPADVSVVGYDDNPLLVFSDPPLTTVRQPLGAMTEAAVAALITRIDGRPQRARELLFHGDLVVRASTGRVRTA
jgi:alanine racemase